MNHERRAVFAVSEKSEIKTYSLDGCDQKVFIEGKYKKNPIVIFLYGGIQNSGHMPGNAAMDYITKDGFDFLDSRIAK